MAMMGVNKLKVGATFAEEEQPYKVMKYEFIKMGRGSANIKVKARNLLTGAIVTKSYLSGGRVEEVTLNKVEMQYLYNDGQKAYFMDPRTYEQIEMDLDVIGDDIKYLVEGGEAWVQSWEDQVLGVEIPPAVILTVAKTEDWVKGNSATNVYKPAELESGMIIQVPLFIKVGDKIKVNTTSGTYTNRANE